MDLILFTLTKVHIYKYKMVPDRQHNIYNTYAAEIKEIIGRYKKSTSVDGNDVIGSGLVLSPRALEKRF